MRSTESEDQFTQRMVDYLEKYFDVQHQVYSKCRKGKIDLIITHKNSDYHFGVELKRDDSKKGEEIGEYVKQAIRYSNYEFEISEGVYQKIPICICPPLSYRYFLMNNEEKVTGFDRWHKDRHTENFIHHSFNGFLGAFGIGEIRAFDSSHQKYLYISHSNQSVWSGYDNIVSNSRYDYWTGKVDKLKIDQIIL